MLQFKTLLPLKNCNFLHLVIYLPKWYLRSSGKIRNVRQKLYPMFKVDVHCAIHVKAKFNHTYTMYYILSIYTRAHTLLTNKPIILNGLDHFVLGF